MLYAKNYSLYGYNNINDFNLVKEYLELCSIYKSETTVTTYKSSLKIFYIFYVSYLKENNIKCEEYLIKSFDTKTLEAFINSQINKKLSEDVIITRTAGVKDYLKYLSKNKIIDSQKFLDIFYDLKLPKRKIKSQICIKSNEAMRLIEILKKQKDTFLNRRNILMILLMSNTGIRRKEIAGINPNAINFNDNTITIYKTKNSKPRIVAFSNSIKDTIINYLKDREYILKKHRRESESFLIKSNGEDLLVNSVSEVFNRFEKRYNFKITCHSLRRGFATDMAENKTDIYLLSKMLGHENINTTASRYIQVFSNTIKEAMNNHPLSKLHLKNNFKNKLKSEMEKEMTKDSVNRDELVLRINLLTQELNKLSQELNKEV